MRVNESELNSSVLPRDPPAEGAPRRQPWVTSTLAAILIFTIAVDLLGNLLVILSVYRNKKLRNAGKGRRGGPGAPPGLGWAGGGPRSGVQLCGLLVCPGNFPRAPNSGLGHSAPSPAGGDRL